MRDEEGGQVSNKIVLLYHNQIMFRIECYYI